MTALRTNYASGQQLPAADLVAINTQVNFLTTSTLTPVATGSVTQRALADRFADTINSLDYGVAADGVTDDTAAWALIWARVATLQSAGKKFATVRVVGGTSNVSATQAIVANGIDVRIQTLGKFNFFCSQAGDGVTVAVTNGGNFGVTGSLGVWKAQTGAQAGRGFVLTSDVSAGPTQPVKQVDGLDVLGAFLRGIHIDASQVVLNNPQVNIGTSAARSTSSIGIWWGNTTTYQTGLTINNPNVLGANTGITGSAMTQGAVVNGGNVLTCDYGVILDGTGGACQAWSFPDTYFANTTRNIVMRGSAQLCKFTSNLHEPYVGGAGSPTVASLDGKWIAIDLEGADFNTFLDQSVYASGVAASSFVRMVSSPFNFVEGTLVNGLVNPAAFLDNNSYRSRVLIESGNSNSGTTAALDPTSTLNASTVIAHGYNGLEQLTPLILVQNGGGALYGTYNGSFAVGLPGAAANQVCTLFQNNVGAEAAGGYTLLSNPGSGFTYTFPAYQKSLHIVDLTATVAAGTFYLPSMYDGSGNFIGQDGYLVEITARGYGVTSATFHGSANDTAAGVGWYNQPTAIQANTPLVLKFIKSTKKWLATYGGF